MKADAEHPIPEGIFSDFLQVAKETGNVINGRKTFDVMKALMPNGIPGIEAVIVSRSNLESDGVSFAKEPEEAITHLEKKGFETALVGGGGQLFNAFLSRNMVDKIILNVVPVLLPDRIRIGSENNNIENLQLIDSKKLSNGIMQLHYTVKA